MRAAIFEIVGRQLRFIMGGVALGYWQGSVMAGCFGYFLLVTLQDNES